jgi:hypothetical protein
MFLSDELEGHGSIIQETERWGDEEKGSEKSISRSSLRVVKVIFLGLQISEGRLKVADEKHLDCYLGYARCLLDALVICHYKEDRGWKTGPGADIKRKLSLRGRSEVTDAAICIRSFRLLYHPSDSSQ